jgi:hypothetical protein
MTLENFTCNVVVLCQLYDGRVTSWARSAHHNRLVGGVSNSLHLVGLAADVVLFDWRDQRAFISMAERLKLTVIDEVADKGHLHLQPAGMPG